MIVFVSALLKEIFKKGKNYPWPRPDTCPCCKASNLWGHGHVTAYFDGFSHALYLRRYRCPGCGCVVKLKPDGYLIRFQASVKKIRSSICCKLKTNRWLPGLSRSRQNHWFRSLIRKTKAYLGNRWDQNLLKAFDFLIHKGQNPVSRSI